MYFHAFVNYFELITVSLKQKTNIFFMNLYYKVFFIYQKMQNLNDNNHTFSSFFHSMLHNKLIILMLLISMMIELISCGNDTHPTSILVANQYHFIPYGSFFKFTFTSMKIEQEQYNLTISEWNCLVTINVNFNFNPNNLQNPLAYNILVFPQNSPDSQILHSKYDKAVKQGIPDLMPPFPYNQSQTNGADCQVCYQQALYSNIPTACINCTVQQMAINLTSQKWTSLQTWNSTYLTVIDNSDVITNLSDSKLQPQIQFTMGYSVSISYDQEYEALFILFFSVIMTLIIILAILAVFLTIKIRKVEKDIKSCNEKVKSQ